LLLVTFIFCKTPDEGPVPQGRAYETTKGQEIHGPKVSGSKVTVWSTLCRL